MRKFLLLISIILALCCAFVLFGCGDQEDDQVNKSVYELYKEKYNYTGTVDEWLEEINELITSKQKYEVKFDVNGDNTIIPSQEVLHCGKVTKPNNPIMEGFNFIGWYINDEEWSFSGDIVTDNITLVAKFEVNDEHNFAFT